MMSKAVSYLPKHPHGLLNHGQNSSCIMRVSDLALEIMACC